MCTCTSCEFTDGYADKGFAAWPRGPAKGKTKSEAEYRAHVAHVYSGAAKTVGFTPGQAPRYPVNGTDRTDPRIYYHFPGGQQGKTRPRQPDGILVSRDGYPRKYAVGIDGISTREYVEAFLTANNLTADSPPKRESSPARPRSRRKDMVAA